MSSRHPRRARSTKASQAADRLREAIIRRRVDTTRPLREVELSRQLGISRIPLREALHQLEGEGLIDIRPHRGAVVAPLSRAELTEIAELCRLLETFAIRKAVPRLTRGALDRAEGIVEELDGISDPIEWSRRNWDFHAELYGTAQRPRLVGVVGVLRANAERYMYMLLEDRKRRVALNMEHKMILEACRARRATRAQALLDAHLLGGKEKVMHLLDAVQPRGASRKR